MPYATTGAVRLYYEIRGAGSPLLYLSGTGSDLRRPPNALERQLAADFQVLMFDQRGLGQSDKPDCCYTMAGYAQDAAALLDAVRWPACPVLGYSFGGMVAQELALRFPERVERLTLLSTTSGGPGGSSYPYHELISLTPAQRARRMVELGDLRRDEQWQSENPKLFQALQAEALASIEFAAEETDHGMGERRQLEARCGHDTWDRLPQLRLPVSVLGGRYDGVAAPACQESLAGRIRGAAFKLFEGGHLFFLQDSRAYPRIRASLAG
ncbi:MAG: alpha/beta hydrolase [Rhodocyclaceae bacterium]